MLSEREQVRRQSIGKVISVLSREHGFKLKQRSQETTEIREKEPPGCTFITHQSRKKSYDRRDNGIGMLLENDDYNKLNSTKPLNSRTTFHGTDFHSLRIVGEPLGEAKRDSIGSNETPY